MVSIWATSADVFDCFRVTMLAFLYVLNRGTEETSVAYLLDEVSPVKPALEITFLNIISNKYKTGQSGQLPGHIGVSNRKDYRLV
jgi:hypothetical protein